MRHTRRVHTRKGKDTARLLQSRQPDAEHPRKQYEEKRQAIADPLQRLLPGYERQHLIATLFDTSLNNAIIQLNGVD